MELVYYVIAKKITHTQTKRIYKNRMFVRSIERRNGKKTLC